MEAHERKLEALGQGDGAGDSTQALDINKVVVPTDDLSRQALAALAEDLALEDALVVLDKALLQGKMAPEVYLKQVSILLLVLHPARALVDGVLLRDHCTALWAVQHPSMTPTGFVCYYLCAKGEARPRRFDGLSGPVMLARPITRISVACSAVASSCC